MPSGQREPPLGLPESVFELREKAARWRELAHHFGWNQDAERNLLDYADELDLRANALEDDDSGD